MKKNLLSFLTILSSYQSWRLVHQVAANSNDKLTMVWYPNESGNDLKVRVMKLEK